MTTVKILCVDVETSLERNYREALEAAEGCHLETVRTLAEARERFWTGEFSLVMLHVPASYPADEFTAFVGEIYTSLMPIPVLGIAEANDPALRLRLLKVGAVECLSSPLDRTRLSYLIRSVTAGSRGGKRLPRKEKEAGKRADAAFEELSGGSPAMEPLVAQFRAVSPLETTVLLTGETGSGKTHWARLIHELSPRRNKPFVVVQCSALSATLIQSELFGHAKGSFTGADCEHAGLFAEAEDGTLLLDDIDCIPLEAQARLLRVVEDRLFEPVGSSRSRPFRARLVTATNRVLVDEVAAGRFRSDLYHRLNVVHLPLPPLRQRTAEILPLAARFLVKFAAQAGCDVPQWSGDAGLALEAYSWPGNVRELRNLAERTVALCRRPIIELEDLPEHIQTSYRTAHRGEPTDASGPGNELRAARRDGERRRLLSALQSHDNNRARTAAHLGVSRVTLYRKLRQYGLV